jgi:multidrug efflux system membrane fusion protein
VITQLSPIDVEFAVPQDQVPVLQRASTSAVLPAIALDRTRTQNLAPAASRAGQPGRHPDRHRARQGALQNDGGKLFPSQFVNVRLELRTIKDAVMVPVTALRHGASGDFVYVLNRRPHGRAAQRHARPGDRGQGADYQRPAGRRDA